VRGPREPFVAFGIDYQEMWWFADSLARLKPRLAAPVGDRVVEGLRIAPREVGGSELGSLLRNLSGFLQKDARTRSELESRPSWTMKSAHEFSQ
jgi:tight adherence protein B